MSDLVEVRGLTIVAGSGPGDEVPIVRDVDFSIAKGECLR